MTDAEIKTTILNFAEQIGNTSGIRDAHARAMRRNWLDQAGEPTEDGRMLVQELGGQTNTRTVFRPFA